MGFLNPRQDFRLEFVVSEYETGAADVAAAAPGLQVRRRDPNRWELPTSVLRGVGLSLIGVRYDPAAVSMSEIATELRSVRRYVTRATAAKDESKPTEGDAAHLYRLVKSDSQLKMVRYMHGVDDHWVPLTTLASCGGIGRETAKHFLDELCTVGLASVKTGHFEDEYKLSYRVGPH